MFEAGNQVNGKRQAVINKTDRWKNRRSGGPPTLITPDMIEEDVAAFAAHRHRISDYLLEGCWNNTNENGVWRFNDGEADDTPNCDLKPMHFR